MIDPNEPKRILFHKDDQPELPEIAQAEIDAEREAERRRKEENLRLLEEDMDFHPFGDVW